MGFVLDFPVGADRFGNEYGIRLVRRVESTGVV
jgi:hypothetical protein